MIRFGTDGWRGVIARDFTFQNLANVTTGVCRHLKETAPKQNRLTIGFDRRFLSKEFAQMVASVAAFEGFQVAITQSYTPTPVLSYQAKHADDSAGAIVITASHNPCTYNGFKFKQTFGGSALQQTTEAFERAIDQLTDVAVPCASVYQSYVKQGKIQEVDLMPAYQKTIFDLIDTQAITDAHFQVGVDCMYGSGSTHFRAILEALGVTVVEIHAEANPGFGGIAPEPVEKNLKNLSQLVQEQMLDAGFATDGDGDRLGAIDHQGRAFTTQMILSCVYWHMLKNKGKAWNIARSVSTTKMVDLLAEKYGQTCIETPVGFKFIAEKMVEGAAHIGGEESGGVGIETYIPERDGIFTALMLLEMMAVEKKPLADIYQDLCDTIRPYQFLRVDLKVPADTMQKAMAALKENPPQAWGGRKLERLQTIDGFKFYLEDGSWVLIRPSGTEPVFRLYAEAEDLEACRALTQEAEAFVRQA
jgi:phosphomannomutase